MHLPRHFEETRPERLTALIRAYPFATVVVCGEAGLCANPLPLELAADGALHGHVARGNALARADGESVLAIFHGPDGYVSPNWYPSKQADGRAVPTWNYATVQVHGRLRVIEDADWLRALLNTLSTRHEAGLPRPWSVAEAPDDYIDQQLRGIVGVQIDVERMSGKFKLSQNHPAANRRGVIDGLRARATGDDLALAGLMQAAEPEAGA